MQLEDFAKKYETMFKDAEDLGGGLGKAIADFLAAHHPIKAELTRDFKKQDQRLRAALKHKDERMVSVAITILKIAKDNFCEDQYEHRRWRDFMEDLRRELGPEVYDKIMESPKNSLRACT